MTEDRGFGHPTHAIARLTRLSTSDSLPRVPDSPGSAPELRRFLCEVAAHPVLFEAIAVSSTGLADAVKKIAAGDVEVPLKRLRRVALSAARYRSRIVHRPTPFGLLAGVAEVRFADTAKARIGTAHRKRVRADLEWLAGVLDSGEPDALAKLRVVANDLCFRRGDRLVLPFCRADGETPGADDREQTVRHTAAVEVALAAAARPRPFTEVAERLGSEFPEAGPETVHGMLAELVRMGFLLTDLRPPADADDPLHHVLGVLDGHDDLQPITRMLEDYESAPLGTGLQQWETAVARMRKLHVNERPVKVDLGIDADLVLPTAVPEELARAAEAAWRALPATFAPIHRLAEFRAEFVGRYGYDAIVPIQELLDPHRGLGAPSGYLQPPAPHRGPGRERTRDERRDQVLFDLIQHTDGREIVLDEEVVDRLSGHREPPTCPIEACVQVLAESEESLLAGDFGLAVMPLSYTLPGGMFGRFLPLLPGLRDVVAESGAARAGAVPAQLTSVLTRSRFANVAQVPSLTERKLAVGVFADRAVEEGLADLGITADQDRLAVRSLRTGEELVPVLFHGLNPTISMPNAVRLLVDIGEYQSPPWPLWHWGAAGQLPFLPRVRFGRTALSPARWRPDAALLDKTVSWREWSETLRRWRETRRVPDVVEATRTDHRLRLDLRSELDCRQLFDELRKEPGTVLQEEPFDGAFGSGWTGGHPTEIVVPLRPKTPVRPAQPPLSAERIAVASARAQRDDWLSVKLYAEPFAHDELLADHIPALVSAIGADRWFFLRYQDPRAHLRLRFHGDALPAVREWTSHLVAAGLARESIVDTYRPEISRYGGPEAIAFAEAVFHADSIAALAQLNTDLPADLLVAANCLDLASRLHGEGWEDWLRTAYPKDRSHAAFQAQRKEAVRLLSPWDGWPDLPSTVLEAWERRAPHLERYGEVLRDLTARGAIESPSSAFRAVLHMHHNRLAGISPAAERNCYAIARGVAQARADRERNR
ncbi:lantibiotic dehydratase [Amycolatopsis sp. WGS_07]|uniref:lantibiotic dehydratase n=1 Tax=Amycolatopsis sp. WGS_07 TaxID=3076764 RepID=UPI00387398CD